MFYPFYHVLYMFFMYQVLIMATFSVVRAFGLNIAQVSASLIPKAHCMK